MHSMWVTRAMERAAALQISADKLLASYDLVCGALGEEWLREKEERLAQPSHTVSDDHPLHVELGAPTDTALVAICELAEYLRHFQHDPAIADIVSDLKTDKYFSTFFELAMAYRWSKAGAAVRLHPAIPKGEADFEAIIVGKGFIVEVSSFPGEVLSRPQFRLPIVVCNAVDTTIGKQTPIAIKVEIKQIPAGDYQGVVYKEVSQACAVFNQAVRSGKSEPISHTGTFCTVQVELITAQTEPNPFLRDQYKRIVDAREHEWDVYIRLVTKTAPEGAPMYRALDDEEGRERRRIFMRFPPDSGDPYEKIIKKIRKESRQLHGISEPRVIILDTSGLVGDVFELQLAQIRDELLHLMRQTPELVCVWLQARRWSTAHRFKYWGVHAGNPDSVYQLPSSFLRNLFLREWKWDFLGERELVSLGLEEDVKRYAERAE